MAIKSFADDTTADIYHGVNTKAARRIPMDAWKPARKRMDQLHAADNKLQLAQLTGLHFESLDRDRPGFYSVRINLRYRLIFRFENGDAYVVSIENYHGRTTS